MTLLSNHDTKIPVSTNSEVKTGPVSGSAPAGSKHANDNVASSGGSGAKAGMGSDRLPQGKLDSSRVP